MATIKFFGDFFSVHASMRSDTMCFPFRPSYGPSPNRCCVLNCCVYDCDLPLKLTATSGPRGEQPRLCVSLRVRVERGPLLPVEGKSCMNYARIYK